MKILNKKGFNHAKSLIREGKVDLESSWSFTTDDENAILGDGNWSEYEKWFLCIDTSANEETKARYKYPYGKNGKVYRRGVIAAKQRASQHGDTVIAQAADELLTMIDEKYNKEEEKAMSNIVRKVFKGEVESINEKSFMIEAVVSDETIDRYNEVIAISAWKRGLDNYKEHPILLSSHNYDDLTAQIGEVVDIKIKDRKLVAKMKYYVGEGNDQADWGYKLATKGLAAFSVGFIPKSYVTDPEEIKSVLGISDNKAKLPKLVYTDVELLEISQVLIPANPAALAKAFDNESDPVIKSIYKLGQELIETESVTTKEEDSSIEKEDAEVKESVKVDCPIVDDIKILLNHVEAIKAVVENLRYSLSVINGKVDYLQEMIAKSNSSSEFGADMGNRIDSVVEEFKKFVEILK